MAERFRATCSEEYSRDYAAQKGAPLTSDDVEPIAQGQIAREDAAARAARSLLILDTDLLSTVLYSRHYYGRCPSWIELAARFRRGDVYLLCHPDTPWQPDGVRDRGNRRDEMHCLFEEILAEFAVVTVPLKGTWSDRETAAENAIRALGAKP
jgi:nicotinamide riboside kinase